MSKRWQEAIERVKRGDISPALTAAADQVFAALTDESADAPKVIEI